MAIYGKTPLGTQAVETRAPPLPPRSRQILIMLDGRRDSGELEKAFGTETVAGIVQTLLDAGLIEATGAAAAPANAAPAVPPSVVATASSAADRALLEQVRELMVDSTRAYTGPGGKALVQRLREAADLPALTSLREEWARNLAQNPLALEAIHALEKRVDALLRQPS